MLKIILLATSLLLIGSQAAPIVERYGLSDYAVYVKLPSKTIGRSANGTVIGPDSAKYPGFNHMVSARPFGFYVDRDFYGPYFKVRSYENRNKLTATSALWPITLRLIRMSDSPSR